MNKQGKTDKNLIMWGIVIVVAILFIGPKLGLFSTVAPESPNITDFVSAFTSLGATNCQYFSESGGKNVICCINNTDKSSCVQTFSYMAIQATAFTNSSILYTCTEHLLPLNPSNRTISGVTVYSLAEGYSNVICSTDNKYSIGFANSDLLNTYINKFRVEQTNQTNNSTRPCGTVYGAVLCIDNAPKCILGYHMTHPVLDSSDGLVNTCRDRSWFIWGGIIFGILVLFLLFKK